MITLYAFGRAFGLPDPSPFVMKAEMLLKLAQLPYHIDTATGFKRAPKGKLPYIDDSGSIVADSTFIRWHLEKKYGIDFDAGLSAAERGVAWAVEKLCEEHIYWAVVDSRWNNDDNFAKGPANFFKKVPWPMRRFIQTMVRRKLKKAMHGHGMGRHSADEITTLVSKSIESVAAILGDKMYLMGDKPCGVDATLFAFTASLLCKHFDTPIRTTAEAQPNLLAYAGRMMKQYYPELIV